MSTDTNRRPALQTVWPDPLSPAEWDKRFPGILDSLAIAGGGANIILQLARPGVGYGVMESRVESGAVFKHPFKRARTTFTYLAVAFLGNSHEKLAYREAVNRSHRQVYSTRESPVKYSAMDGGLQLWVAACLFFGVLDTHEKFHGAFTDAQADELVRLAQPLATVLQVPPDVWPQNIASFRQYWNSHIDSVHIDDRIRGFLTDVVDLKFFPPVISKTLGPTYKFITAGFLPAPIRNAMQLNWSARHQRAFDVLMKTVAVLHNPWPRVLRQLPVTLIMWDFRRRLRTGAALV